MNRKTIWKVILLIILLILLAGLSVVAYITAKLDLIQYADEVDASAIRDTLSIEQIEQMDEEEGGAYVVDIEGLEQVETLPVIPEGEIHEQKDVLNILVLGTDERTKELNVNARSDAMILVSINKTDNTVKLVSLERGMGVPILEIQCGELTACTVGELFYLFELSSALTGAMSGSDPFAPVACPSQEAVLEHLHRM